MRQATKGPISAGGSGKILRVRAGASREEAPEESIFLKRDAVPDGLWTGSEQSGTQEWSTQEGPQNTERLWPRGRRSKADRPDERKTSEPSGRAVE